MSDRNAVPAAAGSRFTRPALATLVVLLPAALAFTLPQAFFGASLLDFVPYYNDEVEYWHETASFIEAGFSGGYYTVDERPAAAAFSPFGSHGPWYPALYGLLGRLTGWRLNSAPLFHLLLLCGAVALYVRATRPDLPRLALLGLLLATFWPLVFLVPSNMQLALHCALAIVLAIPFSAPLAANPARRRHRRTATALLIGAAALIRPTWSLLFFPLFLLPAPRSLRSGVAAIAAATGSIGASVLIFGYFSAPHPDFAATRFFSPEALSQVVWRIGRNLTNLLTFGDQHALEILQHYQVLLVVGASAALLLHRRFRTAALQSGARSDEALFHLLNFVPLLAISIVVYDIWDWRDYRVFAPHLLLSLLVALRRSSRSPLIAAVLVANLLLTPAFVAAYREFTSVYFRVERAEIEAFRRQASALRFDPAAGRWCNTLLTSTDGYALVAVPPGIGISYIFGLEPPARSRYVLLDEAFLRDRRAWASSPHLEPLADTALGRLYANSAADCEQAPADSSR